MNEDFVRRAYAVLKDTCGASERMEAAFMYEFTKDEHTSEWRFQGKLGYGGKFRVNNNGIYVDCYQEDETPERLAMIEQANIQLYALATEYKPAPA